MNIFVGNLSSEVTDDDLKQAFEAYGKVVSVKVIRDMFTGSSKGFGFIEMPSKDEANTAIKELTGHNLKGKPIAVNEARPKRDKRKSSRNGGRGRRY